MDYTSFPSEVLEDVVRLQRRIRKSGVPAKKTDQNLIIATWNIRALSEYFESWDENPGSPKRNRRALVYIAEVIRHFDVVAIQEPHKEKGFIQSIGPLPYLGRIQDRQEHRTDRGQPGT